MGANSHAINKSALNEGSRLVLLATSTLAAASTVNADITYYWKVAENLPAVAEVSSYVDQTHQIFADINGYGSFVESGYVQKWVDGSPTTYSELLSTILPTGATGEFDGVATLTPTVTYVHQYQNEDVYAEASFNVDSDLVTFDLYAQSAMYTASELYNSYKIKLNGESTYTHYVAEDMSGIGSIDTSVITFVYDGTAYAFGDISSSYSTYKWRVLANGLSTAVIDADAFYTLKATSSPTGTATFPAPTAKTFNYPESTMFADATTLIGFVRQIFRPTVAMTGSVSGAGQLIQKHFGGYNYATATASVSPTHTVSRFVNTAGNANAAIDSETFVWTIQQGASDFAATSSINARADVRGIDAVTFLRTPDVKDFVRVADNKYFLRPVL